MPSADVIVVGAGQVGLVTAYGLARAGVSVTVLEAEHDVVDSPRAIVYHWALLEDLERLDLLTEIDRRGFRKDDYGYRVHATGEMLTYTLDVLADETPFPYIIHLGQDALCRIVLERLKSLPHATVRWGAAVTALDQDADEVRATATTSDGEEQHDAAWLIGADGARSTLRRLLSVPFEGMTWEQRFVATNVFFDFGAHGYTRSVFLMDDVHGAVIAKITDQDLWGSRIPSRSPSPGSRSAIGSTRTTPRSCPAEVPTNSSSTPATGCTSARPNACASAVCCLRATPPTRPTRRAASAWPAACAARSR